MATIVISPYFCLDSSTINQLPNFVASGLFLSFSSAGTLVHILLLSSFSCASPPSLQTTHSTLVWPHDQGENHLGFPGCPTTKKEEVNTAAIHNDGVVNKVGEER